MVHNILESTVLGNVIGIVSFVMGIASIILTIRVDKKAADIKKEIGEAKSKAITKAALKDYIPIATEKFSNVSDAIEYSGSATSQLLLSLSRVFGGLLSYAKIFNDDDLQIIVEANDFINTFPEHNDEKSLQKLVSYIENVNGILKRGDFLE